MKNSSFSNPLPDQMNHVSPKGERLVFMVRKDVKRLLEAGRNSFNERDVEGALAQYERAREIDPNCALVYFNLGYVYHEDGRYEHARDSYQKAINLEPTCSLFLEHLARLSFETLDYSESIRLFSRASLVGTIQPVSLGLWGRALFEAGMYSDAVQAFEQLLRRDAQETIQIGARFWLIASYLRLERLAQARQISAELLDKENIDHKLLLDLGENFLKVRCLDLAREVFERLAMEREELLIARLRLEDICRLEERIADHMPQLFQGDEDHVLHHLTHLKHFGTDKISRALIMLFSSPSPLIREAVIHYQTAFGYDVSDHMQMLLADPVAYVRRAAYGFFSERDDPAYVGLIERGLDDSDNEVQTIAADYLSRHAKMPVLPHLELTLQAAGDDEELRRVLRAAIASVKRRHQSTIDELYATSVAARERDLGKPWWRKRWVLSLQAALILYLIWKILASLYPVTG